jgi:hypothetical protein
MVSYKKAEVIELKKKALTAVAVAITVITALMILTGCPATDKQQDGFAVGFGQPHRTSSAIIVAAQSDKSVFAIDEVTLNFYFGGYAVVNINSLDDWYGGHQNEEDMLPIAVYFVDGDVYPSWRSGTSEYPRFDDFRKVEGYHFVKEISIDKFMGGYLVINESMTKRSFSHSEMLTVPQDIFRIFNYAKDSGSFYFFVGQVVYDFKAHKQTFHAGSDSSVEIGYQFLNDTTVRLH